VPEQTTLGRIVAWARGDVYRFGVWAIAAGLGAFLVLGAVTLVVGIAVAVYFRRQEPRLPDGRAALHMGAYAAGGLAAVMAVYFIGDSAGLSNLWIAVIEVALAVCLVMAVFARKGEELGAVIRNRDLWLINLAFIAVLWSLWFFSFWSVSIVADAAHSSFGRSALIAAFNAGAGILGFLPVGGWLSDVAARPRDRPPAARDRVHVHADAGDAGVRVRAPRQRAVGVADDRAAVQREHVLQRDAADGPGHARRHSRTPPTAARRLG